MIMSAKPSPLLILLAIFLTLHPSHISGEEEDLTPNSTDPNILYDIYPFIRVYKNGTIQRFIGQGFSPATTDPTTGVRSKDVTFSLKPYLSARLYLPKTATTRRRKLPLLIYFHGGGFFIESAFSPTYHKHLNSLVSEANVVAVSVNYRLAPEHLLPAAYQDSWHAIQWTFSHDNKGGPEPWLNSYADFNRVYLGGDSAGANIAHRMAVRFGSENPNRSPGVKFRGMFLNCPYFLGKVPIGGESSAENAYAETQMQQLWLHAYPGSRAGLDDPYVNPGMDPGLKMVGCKRVLVYVAGNDLLRFRGWYYKEKLEKSGWDGDVKVVEVKEEGHVFNLANPNSSKAVVMLKTLASFLNRY